MGEIEGSGSGRSRGKGRRERGKGRRGDGISGIDDPERILNDGHHAKAEEIHLDEPHVGAVVLVPLNDHAAGHAGVLERHDLIETSLADHHSSGVLPEVTGEILNASPEPPEQLYRRLLAVEPHLAEVALERLLGVHPLEAVHQLREAIDLRRLEREHLADVARRAPPPIRDDVGRHCGAELPVLLVDVLDHLLAPIAARQIQVDIGPLATFLREKPFEQEIHADRIHGRDPEAVADGAVCR